MTGRERLAVIGVRVDLDTLMALLSSRRLSRSVLDLCREIAGRAQAALGEIAR